MAKFRKKPVVIEAWKWTGDPKTSEPQPIWLHTNQNVRFTDNLTIEVKTLEGIMLAMPGDWIIKGVQNEIYPCKPSVFAETYELAENTPLAVSYEVTA